ncbi:MAG: arylsulfatase [Opitutaceae bacterium]|nr:arylsulfatase [Opitutaceae bacterium]
MRLLPFFFLAAVAACGAAARPNIVLILADDLGWGDLGCYNPQSKIATPHLDALAAGGVRFTDAHTPSSVCTPTRYGLLTGRYSWRTRLKNGVLDGFSPPLIEPGRATVAAFFKNLGYRTAAFGKWHLGMTWTRTDGTPETADRGTAPGFRPGDTIDFTKPVTGGPNAVGFDHYFGISASLDMPPYCWIENDRCVGAVTAAVPDSRDMFASQGGGRGAPGFATDQVLPTLKTKTTEWIARHRRESPGQPFFVYAPLNSPHLPVAPSAAFRGKSQVGAYGDFVMETDDYVGAVVAALRAAGALDDTIVIFTADNGGLWHQWDPQEPDDLANYQPTPRGKSNRGFGHQSNAHLRGTKADIWEGGHRVPFIVSWPARAKPGVAALPVELTDVFATLAEIAGAPLAAAAAPDSFSFFPALRDPAVAKNARPFLVHHSIRGVFALRQGPWKFVEARGSGGFSKQAVVTPKAGEAAGQLYHLADDPAETKNVFSAERARVVRFNELLEKLRAGESLRRDFSAGGNHP